MRTRSSTRARTTPTRPSAGSRRCAESARNRLDPAEPHWGLIELAYASPAALAIVPAQDVLGLGSEARMNRPGTRTGTGGGGSSRASSRRRWRGACAGSRRSTAARQREVDRARRAGAEAVDRERRQRPRLEVPHEEPHREIRGERRAQRADERRPAHAVPCGPASSGSFRTAAARMIGVARRNAKRAASLCERPTSRPPPIDAPEREKPGMSAIACAAPTRERLPPARPSARFACRRRPRSRARAAAAARRRTGAGR